MLCHLSRNTSNRRFIPKDSAAGHIFNGIYYFQIPLFAKVPQCWEHFGDIAIGVPIGRQASNIHSIPSHSQEAAEAYRRSASARDTFKTNPIQPDISARAIEQNEKPPNGQLSSQGSSEWPDSPRWRAWQEDEIPQRKLLRQIPPQLFHHLWEIARRWLDDFDYNSPSQAVNLVTPWSAEVDPYTYVHVRWQNNTSADYQGPKPGQRPRERRLVSLKGQRYETNPDQFLDMTRFFIVKAAREEQASLLSSDDKALNIYVAIRQLEVPKEPGNMKEPQEFYRDSFAAGLEPQPDDPEITLADYDAEDLFSLQNLRLAEGRSGMPTAESEPEMMRLYKDPSRPPVLSPPTWKLAPKTDRQRGGSSSSSSSSSSSVVAGDSTSTSSQGLQQPPRKNRSDR
ncbi:MAG: hypothetical protein M1837_001969 [Sclerophora amabilis]|nr:MAG: hypothetical protein M1837_001969 [Sclerophora amabilis]